MGIHLVLEVIFFLYDKYSSTLFLDYPSLVQYVECVECNEGVLGPAFVYISIIMTRCLLNSRA